MVFSNNSAKLLKKMRIDAEKYSKDLEEIFSDDAKYFEIMCQKFIHLNPINEYEDSQYFNEFIKKHNIPQTNDKLCNYLQEWQNNLCNFYEGGVLVLYKRRQPDWGSPKVRITKDDVSKSDVAILSEPQLIYRGMSREEHSSGQYDQSWTLSKKIAQDFASNIYETQNNGIVVKTYISRDSVVHYEKDEIPEEKEVIVEFGSISKKT